MRHDGVGFGGEAEKEGEVGLGEAGGAVAIDVDDADDLAGGAEHGGSHLAAHVVAHAHVAGIGGDVGDDLGAAVKGDPAGDALAKLKGNVAGAAGEAVVDLDFESTGVGIKEGNGAGDGAEDLEVSGEDGGEGLRRGIAATE